jgi:hypothetical protein
LVIEMDDRQRQVIEHRMSQANAVLSALAAHGPRAFYSPQYDLTAYFYVDSVMQGWFVDYRTGMKHEASRAPAMFGDPERGLLQELIGYIRTGKAIDASWLERFGYGADDIAKVLEAVAELDLISDKSA